MKELHIRLYNYGKSLPIPFSDFTALEYFNYQRALNPVKLCGKKVLHTFKIDADKTLDKLSPAKIALLNYAVKSNGKKDISAVIRLPFSLKNILYALQLRLILHRARIRFLFNYSDKKYV